MHTSTLDFRFIKNPLAALLAVPKSPFCNSSLPIGWKYQAPFLSRLASYYAYASSADNILFNHIAPNSFLTILSLSRYLLSGRQRRNNPGLLVPYRRGSPSLSKTSFSREAFITLLYPTFKESMVIECDEIELSSCPESHRSIEMTVFRKNKERQGFSRGIRR